MLDLVYPVLVCLCALIIDRIFGEPEYHPLILFGNLAGRLEKRLNQRRSRFLGFLTTLTLIGTPLGIIVFIDLSISHFWLKMAFDILILYFVIGWQSMKQHSMRIYQPLRVGDINLARINLAMIVSRQTEDMNEAQIVGSTIESVLENGHDCVFASLFWYLLLGPGGAIMHRLANTLDAMWGYKNERFCEFGFAAARFDDLLGYIPARLTALSYALSGSFRNAIKAWRNQIGQHKSPNAGLVMASGAGALGIIIGGPAIYEGIEQQKPYLGSGRPAQPADIAASIRLIHRSLLVWLLVMTLVLYGIGLFIQVS